MGNNVISGVVQWDETGFGSPVTLMVYDPHELERQSKPAMLLFDPQEGLEYTALEISVDGRRFKAVHSNTKVAWESVDSPVVQAVWWASAFRVTEEFFVSPSEPTLYRIVRVENRGEAPGNIELHLPFRPADDRLALHRPAE